MWGRRGSAARLHGVTQQDAQVSSALSASKLKKKQKNSCSGILSARLQGDEHKTQVPKAIIKLPKPFLLLFNLFVANPAIRALNVALYRGNNYSGSSWQ